MTEPPPSPPLGRHFGLPQAVAMNVAQIVGAGVFVTIPLMLAVLPGPYALLGWLAAGLLILLDGLVWAELGAALPGSGGSYRYLLACYGPDTWGRLFAFLFIWQFLLSGPLEIASGLIAMEQFAQALSPAWQKFNADWTWTTSFGLGGGQAVGITVSPGRFLAVGVGVGILVLLYRNLRDLSRFMVVCGVAVLLLLGWVLVVGFWHFDASRAFDFAGTEAVTPGSFATGLAVAMILAVYSYLGYYNVCYIGDEVRDPGRTLPRAVLLSALIVVVLFSLTHLAFLGVVPWAEVPKDNLPAEFMLRVHGPWAVVAVTLCLIASCFASAFSGLLGYSRIPYGAASAGHFFGPLAAVHPTRAFPHRSLLLVGIPVLFWTFFDLGTVISAMVTTRILEQFAAQVIGVMVLRKLRPDLPRPFRIWLYPLPCGLALAGWLYLYCFSDVVYIVLGLATLFAGVAAFLVWSRARGEWPFGAKSTSPEPERRDS